MDNAEPTLVIARYNEDVSWAKGHKHVLIQKDKDMPNIGLEPASFLYFIVTNYQTLDGDYIFVQGYPFDHGNPIDGNPGDTHTSRPDGCPSHCGLNIHDVCYALDLPIKDTYTFKAGGQFKVNAKDIKDRPWEWYVKALYITTQGQAPWVFERLWSVIFPNSVV
jgi:hypothetical protein